MSREIKFRGYSLESNSWKFGNLMEKHHPRYADPTHWCYFIQDKALSLDLVDSGSVGQFTGLKDKNGKEIYEGDIMSSSGVKLVVTFEDGKFCFDNTGGSYGRDFIGQDRVGRLEVIGNIYETPSLLK